SLINFKINYKYIWKAITYGFPLIFHIGGIALLTQVSKIFIIKYIGVDSLGIYSVSFQIAMAMSLLINSFNMAWTPFLFKILKQNDFKGKLTVIRYMRYMVISLLMTTVCLIL